MRRKCDGTDKNLVKAVSLGTGEPIAGGRVSSLTRGVDYKYITCDCGKVFDDVNHYTIWPHGDF